MSEPGQVVSRGGESGDQEWRRNIGVGKVLLAALIRSVNVV